MSPLVSVLWKMDKYKPSGPNHCNTGRGGVPIPGHNPNTDTGQWSTGSTY